MCLRPYLVDDMGGVGCTGVDRRYLEVRQAVLEEDVPVVEEELLLTHTQQARHKGIQGLGARDTRVNRGRKQRARDKDGERVAGVWIDKTSGERERGAWVET